MRNILMGHRPQASYLRGLLFTFTIVLSILVAQAQTVTKSPDGNVALTFQLAQNGVPTYSLDYKGKALTPRFRVGTRQACFKRL